MPQIIQRSFTSGEIAPALQSRADLVKYATGLNRCENFIVRSQGGAYSRPGFSFRGELGDSTKVGRLIPFSFNTEQTYVLVFEDLLIRVMKDGGYVLKAPATITGITQANPAVVTANNTFANGETVVITGVVGMTELNGNSYTVANATGTTFELSATDSTAFTAYTSDGSAQSDGIYEIVSPFTEAELSRVDYVQTADVMTLVHPNHDPRSLGRLADDDWVMSVINYATTTPTPDLPAYAQAGITGITNANPAVVTSSTHGFTTGDEVYIDYVYGMFEVSYRSFVITVISPTTFSLDGEDSTLYGTYSFGGLATRFQNIKKVGSGFGTYNKTYNYVVTAVDEEGIESLPSEETSATVKSLSTTGGLRLDWTPVPGADYYRVYKDPSAGTGIYGWIGDSTNSRFDDYNVAPITSDAPPQDRTPFDGAGNKPSVVSYYQQRQVFANTDNAPQAVYTTQTNNTVSLRASSPTRDDDAVTFTIAAQQVNEIRHLIALDSLLILTSGGEWLVSEGQDRVLTPSTIGVRIQSYNGASWVKPVVVGSTALFMQDKGARMRDLSYEFSSDQYTGNDLSLMSEHLFEGFTIIDMAYAAEPYSILWCVRDDGVMIALTYQREHQVWGWHRHTTDGEFESVTTISEDGRDAVYAIVKRTINGTDVRYVERMEHRETVNAEDAFCVDCGLSYDGAPVTVFTGLDHLEGKDVAILADGNVVTGKTVTSGTVTLDAAASKVHVGLPYTPVIETLDLDLTSVTETLKARAVSVSKVYLELESSRGGFIGPRQDGEVNQAITYQEIKPRYDLDSYDTLPLRTYKPEVVIDPQWSKGGGVRIEQRAPLPMAILSVIPQVDAGGS